MAPASWAMTTRYGTLEAGKAADLVLLDADPLRDIAATRRIDTVVLKGQPLRPCAPRCDAGRRGDSCRCAAGGVEAAVARAPASHRVLDPFARVLEPFSRVFEPLSRERERGQVRIDSAST